ncbi:MAG: beta-N-acetylhexosaminidase [Mariprofundaceae bacterium]
MYQKLMVGLQGLRLSAQERAYLHAQPPLGIILFGRNIESPEQVKQLLDEVRQVTGKATWAAIDEEGGRVNRMPWEPFSGRKHAAEYGDMFAIDPVVAKQAVFDDAYRVGQAMAAMGFTHNCAPVLDLYHEMGHDIIGKRSYGADVDRVAELSMASVEGLHKAGVQAVGKHFPGHGRANADSHVAVPHVDIDLETLLIEAMPFKQVISHGLKHVMSAHVIYTAVEENIATFSSYWLQQVLRQEFSFEGKVWSDDLCMLGAGDDIHQAVQQAAKAGCDVLLVCEPEAVAKLYA